MEDKPMANTDMAVLPTGVATPHTGTLKAEMNQRLQALIALLRSTEPTALMDHWQAELAQQPPEYADACEFLLQERLRDLRLQGVTSRMGLGDSATLFGLYSDLLERAQQVQRQHVLAWAHRTSSVV
jgi:hypothetical protein